MNLQAMTPTPFTASGNVFHVFCVCGKETRSTDVLCDLDAKAGTFYCATCAKALDKQEKEADTR